MQTKTFSSLKGEKRVPNVIYLLSSDKLCNHRIIFSETVKNCWKGPKTCFSCSVKKKVNPLHKIKDSVTEEPKGRTSHTSTSLCTGMQTALSSECTNWFEYSTLYLQFFPKKHSSDTGPDFQLKLSCTLSREKLCPQYNAYL